MKKLIAAVAIIGLASVRIYAQGTVAFANDSTTRFQTNDLAGHVGLTLGPNYYYGLYVGTGTNAPVNSLELVGMATNQTSASFAGRFSGGNPFSLPTKAGYAEGNLITFQIRAWVSGYQSYESAAAAAAAGNGSVFLGQTGLGYGALGGLSPSLIMFGAGAGQVSGGVLSPVIVPEPTTIALAGLGLAGLLIFRRRQ